MADYLKSKNFSPSEEGDFDYLLSMPLWSLCSDKLADLQSKIEQKNQTLARLEKTTADEMWIDELDRLSEAYIQDLKTNFPY
jgi:DNA topoisomerase-2